MSVLFLGDAGRQEWLPGEDRDEDDLICTLDFGIWSGGIFYPFLL